MNKIFDSKINNTRDMTKKEQEEYNAQVLFNAKQKSIEEQIAEMAEQLVNAQEALDFLIMGGM